MNVVTPIRPLRKDYLPFSSTSQAAPSVQFGESVVPELRSPVFAKVFNTNHNHNHNHSDFRFDNDIREVIVKMMKATLHEHQNGSSAVWVLKSILLKKLLNERGEIDTDKMGAFDDLKSLDWDYLSDQYFRVPTLRKRLVTILNKLDSPGLTNTGLTDEERETLREQGLKSYLATSGRINPLSKNIGSVYEIAHAFALDNRLFERVRYVEYRTSPMSFQPASVQSVVHMVNEGLNDAKKHLAEFQKDFDYGIIVLFERSGLKWTRADGTTPDPNEMNQATGNLYRVDDALFLADETIRLKKLGYPIAGIDFAGPETDYPITDYKAVFDKIKAYNADCQPEKRLGITVHAGEAYRSGTMNGPGSIDAAIDLAWNPKTPDIPVRIGHGLRLIDSSSALKEAFKIYQQHPSDWQSRINVDTLLAKSPLLKKVIEWGVVLEMCPKSNVQTYAVEGDDTQENHAYVNHPAIFLSRLGVKISISADNRTITNSHLTNELVKLYRRMGASYQDLKKLVLNGFEGAFVFDPVQKQKMLNQAKAIFEQIETDPKLQVGLYKMHHQGEAPSPGMIWWLMIKAHLKGMFYVSKRFAKNEWRQMLVSWQGACRQNKA